MSGVADWLATGAGHAWIDATFRRARPYGFFDIKEQVDDPREDQNQDRAAWSPPGIPDATSALQWLRGEP